MAQKSRRTLFAAMCAAVALLALVAPASTRSVAATGASPPCNVSFNPYAYTRAAVAACGYKTFPRESVKSLAGGGSGYYYDVNGHTVEFLVPPAGFRPATATGAQLSEYGLPPRPAAPRARARWTAEAGNFRPAPPPPFLAESHAHMSTKFSENWAGYVVTGGPGTYNQAEVWYPEPTFYKSSCASNADTTWAGIGGYHKKTTALGQDGTAHGIPGIGNHQAWWEVWPYNFATPVNLSGHIGYTFDAFVAWHGTARGEYSFYMHDAKTGDEQAFREYFRHYDGTSAEAITERPRMANGQFWNLSNFKTLTISKSQANGHNLSSYPPHSPPTRRGLWMVNAALTRYLAIPGAISSGGHFTVRQQHCA